MRSDVMGDFQEPYGAIFGEFDKLGALLLGYWFSLKIRRKRSPIIAQGCFNPWVQGQDRRNAESVR
jgi:hypothetical protein